MFKISKHEVISLQTRVWVAEQFPAIYSEAYFEGLRVVRNSCGLVIIVNTHSIRIDTQSLVNGTFVLSNLAYLNTGEVIQVWDAVSAMKKEISKLVFSEVNEGIFLTTDRRF